jgi:radical SAM protein with 4Fe4S-binding SPASM domain
MIKLVQLDPNGLCNAGCWFCPVAYTPNPDIGKKTMNPKTIRSIISQLKAGVGDFVDPAFGFIYTAHYNEVLLYKHFKEMLDIFREYKVGTMVLTNGIPLTKEKTDLIKEYQDVVFSIHFNVPSSEAEAWAKMTGMNVKIHAKVMDNIRYAIDNFPHKKLSLQINGVQNASLSSRGGRMTLLENAPDINLDDKTGDMAIALAGMKSRFPEIEVFTNSSLVDRAGYLDEHKVMTNIVSIERDIKQGKNKVVGCNNMGNRTETWLHINANGDVFICCNDYSFDTIFGNIHLFSIKEIWESSDRANMIQHSYKTLCTTCVHAIWE